MRLVSIVGDSISTYEGFNPKGYSVYYDKETQMKNGLSSVYDTWWAKVNQALHAFLCVNDSYSGSRVSGQSFPSACCLPRLENLRSPEGDPDIILIYLGLNDYGCGVKPFRKNSSFQAPDFSVFSEAYDQMLGTLKGLYPNTHIACGTIMKARLRNDGEWVFPERMSGGRLADYNDAIRRQSRKHHCFTADLAALGTTYETLDGTHPTGRGHQELADAWISCLEQAKWLSPSIETCIRYYHANKSNQAAVNAVFHSLMNERVLIPVSGEGNWSMIDCLGQSVIPIFTSPNVIPEEKPMKTKMAVLKDSVDSLRQIKKDIIVNPFCEPNKQFYIPCYIMEKLLIPAAARNE